ncbi:MAG: 3-deoxy-D-manno-oct-2-ulosonic acid (Kdo) hydroxylase [Herminiimonas sp.]|nr:3-deoxy-D-manno-oct-2-ulosonic acid (Kdo) hydroxylase [Herminiimonas sp.]
MEPQILEILAFSLQIGIANDAWIAALESGKVLYFPSIAFTPLPEERSLFTPAIRDPKARNISLDAQGVLKGASGDEVRQAALAAMIERFRAQAKLLIASLFPHYTNGLRLAPTSFRPTLVETRKQSLRADDRQLHIDAFPSRPNRGERLLRVFSNVNPDGIPRVWRVGEQFKEVAQRFLPQVKAYSPWQAKALHALHITKSLRSEYDHLMLQLHDAMKSDADYQKNAPQVRFSFPTGSTWVCFSDQTSHAVMSGQYLFEQTLQLPVAHQYNPDSSPLAILTRLTGRALVPE